MPRHTAIYWDFEYLHDGAMADIHGDGWYESHGSGKQSAVLQVSDIVAKIHKRAGTVVSNRAYCDWQWMPAYGRAFVQSGVDMIQVFASEDGTAADLERKIIGDIRRDVRRNRSLSTVYFLGGSAAYAELADELRREGLNVHAVVSGPQRDERWEEVCTSVFRYDDIPGKELKNVGPRPAPSGKRDLVRHYLKVAAAQGIRMPRPDVMWCGTDIYARYLEQRTRFANFGELDEETLHHLEEHFEKIALTDAKKVRQVLFKCFIFSPSTDGSIGFQEELSGVEDIENRYFKLMIDRIANKIDEPTNYEALSRALTDKPDFAERLETLHQEKP